MTNEETIKSLKKLKSFHNGSYGTAIDLAIKALEQQPCEDWHDVPSDEMTLEQARQAVKDLRKKLAEYLWQQPCEDCISRDEVIEALRTWIQYGHLPNGDYVPLDYLSNPEEYVAFVRFEDAETCINEMPSVTPARPKGKWILIHPLQEDDEGAYMCLCCGVGNWGIDPKVDKYCFNCGADMRGEEE